MTPALDTEIREALSHLAAEFYYTKELKQDLELLSVALQARNVREQILEINKALTHMRRVGREERRAEKHERVVSDAIEHLQEKNHASMSSENTQRLRRRLEVEIRSLIAQTSRYGGSITTHLKELRAAIRQSNQTREWTAAEDALQKLKEEVDRAQQWMAALSSDLNSAKQVVRSREKYAPFLPRVETNSLIGDLWRKGGFFLFHHAAGRFDFNDFDSGDEYNYTRAMFGIRDALVKGRENILLNAVHASQRFHLGGVARIDSLKRDYYIVVSGPVPIEATIQTRRGDFVSRYWEKQILVNVLNTNATEQAWYLYLTFPVHGITDYVGRSGSNPEIVIVSSQDFVEKVQSYLHDNPQEIFPFIKHIVSQKGFPRVNAQIIAHAVLGNRIYFIDVTRFKSSQRMEDMDIDSLIFGSSLPYEFLEEHAEKVDIER